MAKELRLVTFFVVALIASGFILFKEENLQPTTYQPRIASLVGTYLSYYHYERFDIDDKIAIRLFNEYISSLDYNRMFFLKSDIEEFRRFETKLDDDLTAEPAKLDKPFLIFNRYRERVNERVDVILSLLEQDFDFTKDETFQLDRSEAPWPETKAELDELWRLRIKGDLVRFELRDKPAEEAIELLERRYARLKKNIDEYEPADILERYLASLAESFDPHSSYLKPETKENFDIQMGHSLEGIGATLRQEGEYTIVVDLVKGGPADRSKKVHPNDKIIAVAQGDGKAEDVVDMRLDKVVRKIRGDKGTKVRLTMIPADDTTLTQTKEVILIRDRVELTSLDAKSRVHEVDRPDGQVARIGVIEVPSFYMDSGARFRGERDYKSTTRDVRRILKELAKEKVDGVVVDLRQNGGGSLDEAIQLTGLFIDAGPVVQIKDYKGNVRVERDPDPKIVYDGPLLVLTSVFSASASEIFSSAIQDYERGLVVGSTSTHGKGTVQNIVPLQNALAKTLRRALREDVAGALKLTTHKFYRISGGTTQFKGVHPDIVLPSPFDGMKITEEFLDFALPWDEIEQVNHKDYGLVRPSLAYLKTNSAQRVAKDPEFRYVREDLERRERDKEKKLISLKLAIRQKEKQELEGIEKEREKERALRVPVAKSDKPDEVKTEGDDTTPIPDFVLDEALLILRDYISYQSNLIAGVEMPEKKKSL